MTASNPECKNRQNYKEKRKYPQSSVSVFNRISRLNFLKNMKSTELLNHTISTLYLMYLKQNTEEPHNYMTTEHLQKFGQMMVLDEYQNMEIIIMCSQIVVQFGQKSITKKVTRNPPYVWKLRNTLWRRQRGMRSRAQAGDGLCQEEVPFFLSVPPLWGSVVPESPRAIVD